MLRILGRATSSNVQKVVWLCEEVGIPYEREDIGGPFGGNDRPDYLALNPNGRVPTVIDGDFVIWESNACVQYLASRHAAGQLVSRRPANAGPRRAVDGLVAGLARAHPCAGVPGTDPHTAGAAQPGGDRAAAATPGRS